MMGTQHLFTGAVAGTIIAYTLNIPPIPIIIGSCIGSLLPDIDSSKEAPSMISKILPLMNAIVRKFTIHRGVSHDIGIFSILSLIIYFFYHNLLFTNTFWIFLPGVILGVFTHLFLDGLTKRGIPFLLSYKNKKYLHLLPSFLRCRSGSIVSSFYTLLVNAIIITSLFITKTI